jgi:hypothetical protein
MKLRGLSPNSYIHVSLSDLYIPTIGLPILLQENRWTDRENIRGVLGNKCAGQLNLKTVQIREIV